MVVALDELDNRLEEESRDSQVALGLHTTVSRKRKLPRFEERIAVFSKILDLQYPEIESGSSAL
jgi:hypothetical protein